ncbi:hypothetical protein [Roseiconus lacunae]|uniref:hypothetical protein n=1 Tax=Roseiconus lacunae TaxID=2605694 RepID=UPI00135AB4D7|nr:hypothetical protein [Roseiconus lacunae]
MTFDQAVLIWCVCIPAVVTAGIFVALRWIGPSSSRSEANRVQVLLLAVGWWLAITVSISARNAWQLWPSDYWQHAVWPLLGWCIYAAVCFGADRRSFRWILAAILSAIMAYVCLPRGEAWEDTYRLHGLIGISLTTCLLINVWALHEMAMRRAERWVMLVALASLGGPIALAASTYASLSEWGIAMASATAAIAVVGLASPTGLAAAVTPPVLAGGTAVIAAGRFQTYEDHPIWLYATMLLLPTIISAVDSIVSSRPTWLRVGVSAFFATIAIAVSVWFLLIRETESW